MLDNCFTIIYRSTDTGSRRTTGILASNRDVARKIATTNAKKNEVVESVF